MRLFRQLGIALLLLLVPVAVRGAPAAPVGQRWALLVGIDRYDNPDVTPLRYAEADARLVATTLVQSCGFPADHVFLLTSRGQGRMRASRPNLVDWLVRLRQSVRPQDTFVFYFAGHGISLDQGSYLLTVDAITDPVENLKMSALPMTDLSGLLVKIAASHVLIAVDACRSDPRAGRGKADNTMTSGFARDLVLKKAALSHAAAPQVAATLYACQVGKRSYEWPEKGHGFFSYFLAQGLRGAAADARHEVTLFSLMDYLDQRVPEETRLWGVGSGQTPWAKVEGSGAGHWVLSDAALANPGAELPAEDSAPAPASPPPEKALEVKAQAAYDAGHLAEPVGDNAIELAREVLKVKPNDAAAHELEAKAEAVYEQAAKDAAARQDYDRAIAMYRRLAALYPQRADFPAEIAQLQPPPAPDITGVWRHPDGGTVRIKADGTFTDSFLILNFNGRWRCLDTRKRLFELKWDTGYTDTLTLSADGRTLDGTNNEGRHLTYRR